MFDLKCDTPEAWVSVVLNDFDDFLVDHAACERKASATAMSFVVRYRDQIDVINEMIGVAQDELRHFAQVTEIIHARGGQLGPDEKDPYVNALLKHARGAQQDRLIDRLLIFGIIEGRGCERFQMLANALVDPALSEFYHELVRQEARHHASFLRIVKRRLPEAEWKARLQTLLEYEAEIVQQLELRPALH